MAMAMAAMAMVAGEAATTADTGDMAAATGAEREEERSLALNCEINWQDVQFQHILNKPVIICFAFDSIAYSCPSPFKLKQTENLTAPISVICY